MKTGFAFGLLALSLCLNAWGKEPASTLKTEKEKFSYTVGYQMGQNLKQQKLDIDARSTSRGMQDALSGGKPGLTSDQMRAVLQAYHKKEQEKAEALAKKNLETGKAFLEENKKKEGVTTTASGLQYKVLTEGQGKQPKIADTVVAHYRGTLINGTEFDSSYQRHEPATFPVRGVIKGWQEVLPLMKEGAKWQVYIPSELAYGPSGAGSAIGPNEVLIFDIELLSVKEAAASAESGGKEK